MIIRKGFYLMRHGQSVDNALGVISGGGSDPHLTLKGLKQAEIASFHFFQLDPRPTHIIASGLHRAKLTAQVVTGMDLIEDAELNERHLGELDGRISEAEQKHRKVLPGEETSQAHAVRVVRAINRYLGAYELPLFVCHAGTIRRILEAVELKDKTEIKNAEIYYISPSASGWKIT